MLVSRETEGTKREVLDDDGHETFRSSVFLTTQEGPLLSASSMRSDRRQRHCAAPQLHPDEGPSICRRCCEAGTVAGGYLISKEDG